MNFTHDIKTQYGDTFIVSYDSVHGKGNLRIEDIDFYMRLYGDIDENDIVGICNNSEYKCYLVCSTIIFNKIGTETFEILGDDLNSHEELMPIVKSVLLKKSIFFAHIYLIFGTNIHMKHKLCCSSLLMANTINLRSMVYLLMNKRLFR